jgi:hypothetical protein
MATSVSYATGTATVNANSTAVTGQGTAWLTAGLKAGDYFWAAGLLVRIASVNSNTSITLAFPWPGASRSADTYEIRYTSPTERAYSTQSDLLTKMANGNLYSFAELISAANKGLHFTGAGVAALHDQTAHGRAILALAGGAGKFIRSTGTNTAVMQDILGTVSQSGGISTGALFEEATLSSGSYLRLPSGLQICWGTCSLTFAANSDIADNPLTVTYPAPFASANVSLSVTTARGVYASTSSKFFFMVNPFSGAQFALRAYNQAPAATQFNTTTYYQAIGRWF